MKNRILALGIVLALVGLVIARVDLPSPAQPPRTGAAETAGNRELASRSLFHEEGDDPIVVTPAFTQSVGWARDAKVFELVNRELDPTTQSFEESAFEFSLTFAVEAFATRNDGEMYLAGKIGQSMAIEQFVFSRQTGGYFSERPRATTPIGVPVSESTLTVGIEGGTFIHPDQRTSRVVPRRVLMYLGTDIVDLIDMTADPEGRFVLVLANSPGEIYQVPTHEQATATRLYSEAEIPRLGEMCWIAVWRHRALGRCFVLSNDRPSDYLYVVIVDSDNDGNPDSATTYTRSQFVTSGFLDDLESNYVLFGE